MRRTGIIPEYIKYTVPGTYATKEIKNPLCGQLLEVEDIHMVDDHVVFYKQRETTEQIDYTSDPVLIEVYYSEVKKDLHSISQDPSQPLTLRETPRWMINIDLGRIFSRTVFAKLKESRTFEYILLDHILQSTVDEFIYAYISDNIKKRFGFDYIELYVKYEPITSVNPKRNPLWNPNLYGKHHRVSNFALTLNTDDTAKILYTQTKNSNHFNLDYYFTPVWKKL